MNAPGISVKALIADEAGQILLLKRAHDDPHRPGEWEVPGGRLEAGETQIEGLHRQVREETDLRIRIDKPVFERQFQRDDGQWVKMVTYSCYLVGPPNIRLTMEHEGHQWASVRDARRITQSFSQELDAYSESTQ
jgi:8-oxo-dGTP diphosphatase